jgi:hypothetical protein
LKEYAVETIAEFTRKVTMLEESRVTKLDTLYRYGCMCVFLYDWRVVSADVCVCIVWNLSGRRL